MTVQQLGEAAIPIRATLDKLDEDLAGARGKVDKALGGITDNVQKVGSLAMIGIGAGVAAIGGGLAAIGAGLSSVVKEAMAGEDVMAELDAVLKSTGGSAGVTADMATDLANSLQAVTRFEDDAILSGESMLLTFTNIGTDVFPAATEAMLNMTQKFGSMDAASVQLGKALNDPIVGVTALRRVGVMLTDQQEDQVKAFMAVGDVASAQRVILGELEVEFGGLARAAGQTLAGKLDILTNKFGAFKERLGTGVLPILGKLYDVVNPLADKAFAGLADVFETRVLPVVDGAVEFFGNLVGQLQQTEGFWEAVSMAFEGTPFEGLQAGFNDVRDAVEGVTAKIREIVDAVKPYVDVALEWIGTNIELKDVLIALGVAIGTVVVPAILSIVAAAAPIVLTAAALIGAVALIRQAWESDLGGIQEKVAEWKDKIGEAWDTAKTKVAEWWDGTADARAKIAEWYNTFKDETLPAWKEKAGEAWDTAKTKVAEWWDGTADARAKIVEWYNTFKTETLPQFLSKVAETWNVAKAKVQEWWDDTADTRAKIAEWYNTFKDETLPAWGDKFSETWDTAKQNVEGFWTGVSPSLDGLESQLVTFTVAILPDLQEAWAATTLVMDLFKEAIEPLMVFLIPLGVHFGILHDNVKLSAEALGAIVGVILQTGLQRLLDGIERTVRGWADAMEWLASAILTVITKVGELVDALANLSLPDWLTPGSPTPLEIGLRGIADAMHYLSRVEMPEISQRFSALTEVEAAPRAEGSTGTGGYTIINQFGADSIRGEADIYRLAEQIDRSMALRGLARVVG